MAGDPMGYIRDLHAYLWVPCKTHELLDYSLQQKPHFVQHTDSFLTTLTVALIQVKQARCIAACSIAVAPVLHIHGHISQGGSDNMHE